MDISSCESRSHSGCEHCKSYSRSMFASLTEEEHGIINEAKTSTKYKKGQVLFHEGTRPLGVFCISSGRIKVYRKGFDGKEQIIKLSVSGDLLGYKAIISEQHYSLNAEAIEDCRVCFIPKEEFMALLQPGSIEIED